MATENGHGDRASRLRKEIDAGASRDKVAFPDPAAAPLGTDDEAAGTPVRRQQAASARAQEGGRGDAPTEDPVAVQARQLRGIDAAASLHPDPPAAARARRRRIAWGVVAVAVVLVLAVAVLLPLRQG